MELKKRSEFPENELWDLTALYQDQRRFLACTLKRHVKISINLSRNYKGNLHTFRRLRSVPLRSLSKSQIQTEPHWQLQLLCHKRLTLATKHLRRLPKLGMDFETRASVELTFFDDALGRSR